MKRVIEKLGSFLGLNLTKAKDIILIFLKESGGLDSEGFSAADRAEFAKAASRNREYEKKLQQKKIDKGWEASRAKREAQALARAERAFGQKTSVILERIEDARNKPLEFLGDYGSDTTFYDLVAFYSGAEVFSHDAGRSFQNCKHASRRLVTGLT